MARRRRLSAQSELFALFTAEPSVRARMNSIKMVGVLMLDAQPTVAGVRAVVGEQLPSLERFMARCEFRPGEGAFMCWDRPVDIDYHVRALPETDGAGALSVADVEEIVRRVGLARFTPERPLWRLWVCARPLLSHAGEHVCAGAIFAVVDHALGDGASTVASLAHLLGASADELAASLPRSGRTRAPACASEPGERACAYVRTALAGARAREALRGLAVGLFAQFAPRDAPTPLQLARPLDVSSHAPFVLGSAPPVPLRLLREIAARFAGATVNDVAVSALALAVRRRLAQRAREEEAGAREEAGAKDGAGGQAVTRGEPAQRVHAAARRAGAWMPIGTAGRGPAARPPWAQHLRAAVSMSTRPAGEAVLKTSPGNRVGTLNVELPFCSPEPCPRSPDAAARWATALVHAAMAETRSLRLSPAPAITGALSRAVVPRLAALPRAAGVHSLVNTYLTLASKATIVFSNVPGPREPLHVPRALSAPDRSAPGPPREPSTAAPDGMDCTADAIRVVNCRFYAFGHMAVYCGLLSYGGQVSVSCTTDSRAEPRPEKLARELVDALRELHGAVSQLSAPQHAPRPPLGDWLVGAALQLLRCALGAVLCAACACLCACTAYWTIIVK
ncbi:hypothetical protein KFE25_004690 [Diacronema lutheri]|uniref:Diacylglycerol O-acyltransferase n=2 Tax=Diacronema lutheri TaxID=2081491 RepID=A0A8J6C7E8_DIALT|nr:hypothetical protein KFE25_004690 [Diacronema lutheri]